MGLALIRSAGGPAPASGAMARLRVFAPDFAASVQAAAVAGRAAVRIDPVALCAAYLDWRREAPRLADRFAAGVLLRALLRHAPVTVLPAKGAAEGPVRLWPEAYFCVAYCLRLRQHLLAMQPARQPALDDPALWQAFRQAVAADPDQAMAFLERFAGVDPVQAEPPPRVGDAPGPAGRPALRLVGDRPLLPPGTEAVLLDLAAISNSDALALTALSGVLADHGAPLPADEIRRRFLHQPAAAAMTHVALATGRICPGSFATRLRERTEALMASELRLAAGAGDLVAALRDRGLSVRVAAPAGLPPEALARLAGQLPGAEVARAEMPAAVQAAAGAGSAPATVAVLTAPMEVAAARTAGMTVLGMADDPAQRQALLRAGAANVIGDCAALLAPPRSES